MNKILIYNLESTVFVLVETPLSKALILKKTIEFKENGGGEEYELIEFIRKETGAYIKQIPFECVDYELPDDDIDYEADSQ
ncbi:hypothetical protein [Bacillus sp. 1P06AnD]|uniref:hypothetical protein n=1 Tax=Bacillus sp. 1P06AnD TaxID=3132208 RepID=UPI0039A0A225